MSRKVPNPKKSPQGGDDSGRKIDKIKPAAVGPFRKPVRYTIHAQKTLIVRYNTRMSGINKAFLPILKKLRKFRDERDWKQFHDPKNLALAAAIEISELQEHFLWKDRAEVEVYLRDPENKLEAQRELADVFMYLFELADILEIDIERAIDDKILENEKKYPVALSKGVADKYTKLK